MIITYPHAGDMHIALEVFFREMGVEAISPPPSTARTLALGARLAPEFICVPYKVLLGNLVEALELGADTVLTLGKPSGCRLGYYPRLQQAALRERGYAFRMYALPLMNGSAATAIWQVHRITGVPLRRILRGVALGLPVLRMLDELDRAAHYLRPRERTPGAASKIVRAAKARLREVCDAETLARIRRETFAALDAIPLDRTRAPLKIAILGEFYLVIDPFMSMDLEEELGRRGVEVERNIYLSQWLDFNMFLRALRVPETRTLERLAKPYLRRNISGDGLKSIGGTIRFAQAGYDGVLHLQSFTCAPELMASNIMPLVARDYAIPVLRLVFAEQSNRSGLLTRLEAFLDVLERRRNAQRNTPYATRTEL